MAPAHHSTSTSSKLFQLPPHLHSLHRSLAFTLPGKCLTLLVCVHSSSFSSKLSQRGSPAQCAVCSPPHLLASEAGSGSLHLSEHSLAAPHSVSWNIIAQIWLSRQEEAQIARKEPGAMAHGQAISAASQYQLLRC